MAAILEEIRDRRTLVPKAKEVLTALFHRINWFRLGMSFGQLALHLGLAALTGGATAPASAAALAIEKAQHVKVDDLEGLVNKTEERAENVHMTVREFEADFEILLEQTGLRRLVVVIDDLDRCLPDRVIATLEAIRLFLSVPKTVFIIAADDALIRYAVKQRFSEIEGLKVSVDRDYLEKMVQIPVRVPPLGRGDLETYLNMLFVQLHLSEKEFEQVCERLLKASQGQVGKAILTAASAEKYIEHPLSEALREDLALSARLSQVIALSIRW